VYEEGKRVSKIITGNQESSVEVYAYKNIDDLLEKIASFLELY